MLPFLEISSQGKFHYNDVDPTGAAQRETKSDFPGHKKIFELGKTLSIVVGNLFLNFFF